MRPLLTIALILAGLFPARQAVANALSITNFSVDQAAGTVTFDLEWKNSWRVSTVPFNWDAAWVFVKFRECGVSPTTSWTHAQVNTTLSNHSFGNLEPTTADGVAPGIDPAPNNLGVMLRRDAAGLFKNPSPTTVTMALDNLPAAATDIDIKIFGVEMVFIPQASFMIGDGNNSDRAYNVQTINSENAVTIVGSDDGAYNVPAAFPKGFDPFYIMKYEISQEQYADFLNALPSTAESNRFPNENGSRRHTIRNNGPMPDKFVAGREDRALNQVNWDDIGAYLDWAALRPMTEMEYEKACRGQGPVVQFEYPWGSTFRRDISQVSSTSPPEDGTEVSLTPDANSNFGNNTISGGDGGRGPVRVGIFATDTSSTREETGATFYGVMEMGGNVYELVIPTSNNAFSFTDEWGDGSLTSTGEQDASSWPAPGTTTSGSWNNAFIGFRGGSYEDNSNRMRMSRRREVVDENRINDRDEMGGRGVR